MIYKKLNLRVSNIIDDNISDKFLEFIISFFKINNDEYKIKSEVEYEEDTGDHIIKLNLYIDEFTYEYIVNLFKIHYRNGYYLSSIQHLHFYSINDYKYLYIDDYIYKVTDNPVFFDINTVENSLDIILENFENIPFKINNLDEKTLSNLSYLLQYKKMKIEDY